MVDLLVVGSDVDIEDLRRRARVRSDALFPVLAERADGSRVPPGRWRTDPPR